MNRYGIIDHNRFTSFGIAENDLYAVTNEGGYLIRIEKYTGDAYYVCSGVDEKFDEHSVYIVCVRDVAYSLNYSNNHITIMKYDGSDDAKSMMEISSDDKPLYVFIAANFNDSIYVFTKTKHGILVLSDTCRVLSDKSYERIVEKCLVGVRAEDKVLFFLNDNSVYEFDLASESISKSGEMERDGSLIRDVFFDGSYFYILKTDAHLVVVDKKYQKLNDIYLGADYVNAYFARVIKAADHYLLLPSNGDDICIVDNDENIKIYEGYPDDFGWSVLPEHKTLMAKFNYFVEDEDYFYFPKRAMEYILKIDKKTGKLEWMSVDMKNPEQRLCIESKRKNNLITEIGNDDLHALVNHITRSAKQVIIY